MYLQPSHRGRQLGDVDPKDVPFGIGYTGYATWLAWTKEVAAQGGLATDMSAGKYRGLPAARYPAAVIASRRLKEPLVWTTGKAFGYYLAPKKILALDTLHRAQISAAIAAGDVADNLEQISKGIVSSAVLALALAAGGAYLLTRSHS